MNKLFVLFLCISTLFNYNPQITVSPNVNPDKNIEFSTAKGITPYADVIETKFRIKDGKIQYRRWNSTRGYWVDSDWIDL